MKRLLFILCITLILCVGCGRERTEEKNITVKDVLNSIDTEFISTGSQNEIKKNHNISSLGIELSDIASVLDIPEELIVNNEYTFNVTTKINSKFAKEYVYTLESVASAHNNDFENAIISAQETYYDIPQQLRYRKRDDVEWALDIITELPNQLTGNDFIGQIIKVKNIIQELASENVTTEVLFLDDEKTIPAINLHIAFDNELFSNLPDDSLLTFTNIFNIDVIRPYDNFFIKLISSGQSFSEVSNKLDITGEITCIIELMTSNNKYCPVKITMTSGTTSVIDWDQYSNNNIEPTPEIQGGSSVNQIILKNNSALEYSIDYNEQSITLPKEIFGKQ